MCDAEIIDLASDDEDEPMQTNGLSVAKKEEKGTPLETKEIDVRSKLHEVTNKSLNVKRTADDHTAQKIKRIKPVPVKSDTSKASTFSTDYLQSEASTSTSHNLHPNSELFEKYARICRTKDRSTDMDRVLKRLFKSYNAAHCGYKESAEFKKLLLDQLDGSNLPSYQVYVSIMCVRDELKFNKKQEKSESAAVCEPSTSKEGNSTNKCVDTNEGKRVDEVVKKEKENTIKEENYDSDDSLYGFNEERKRKIRKLEKLMRALNKAVAKLEQKEVKWDSDKEEDSAYIKMDRYQNRIVKVYEKICELRKKSADADRPIKRKVSFDGSGYPDIDRYVEKMYNHSRKFPDFHDVYVIVKEVKKNEKLTPDKLHKIAETVFKKFGKLLKLVRQRDDYDIMCSYLPSGRDPALNNQELKKKLEENFKIFQKKEEEVINTYVEKEKKHRLKPKEVNDSDGEQDEDEDEEAEDYDDNIAGKIDNGSDSETNLEHSDNDNSGDKFVKKRRNGSDVNSDDSSNDCKKRKTEIRGGDKLKTDNKDVNFFSKGKSDSVKLKTVSNNKDDRKTASFTDSDKVDIFAGKEISLDNIEDDDLFSFSSSEKVFSNRSNKANKTDIEEKTVSDVKKDKNNSITENIADTVDSVIGTSTDKDNLCDLVNKITDELSSSKSIDNNSKKKDNFSRKGGSDALSDDDCVIEEIKVRNSSAFKIERIVDINDILNNKRAYDFFAKDVDEKDLDKTRVDINDFLNKSMSNFFEDVDKKTSDVIEDVDIVYDGSCDDDDVRVLTPLKKIKCTNGNVDKDSDLSIKIENKIIFSLQPKLADIVKPLATSTPEKKTPKVFNETNVIQPESRRLFQTKISNFECKPSTSSDHGCTQTARVIVDGKRAEYVTKNNAKKVISKGNTKIFTKGVKNNKVVDNNEVITLD